MQVIKLFIVSVALCVGCDPSPQPEASISMTEFMSQSDFAAAAQLMAEHESVLSVTDDQVSIVQESAFDADFRKLAEENCIKVYCDFVYEGTICGATSMVKVINAAIAMCS